MSNARRTYLSFIGAMLLFVWVFWTLSNSAFAPTTKALILAGLSVAAFTFGVLVTREDPESTAALHFSVRELKNRLHSVSRDLQEAQEQIQEYEEAEMLEPRWMAFQLMGHAQISGRATELEGGRYLLEVPDGVGGFRPGVILGPGAIYMGSDTTEQEEVRTAGARRRIELANQFRTLSDAIRFSRNRTWDACQELTNEEVLQVEAWLEAEAEPAERVDRLPATLQACVLQDGEKDDSEEMPL